MWPAAGDKTSGSLKPVPQDSQNSFTLLSTMPTLLPKVGHSRVPPITAGQHFQVSVTGVKTLVPGVYMLYIYNVIVYASQSSSCSLTELVCDLYI